MQSTAFQLSLLSFAALSGACEGEQICSDELRLAVRVHVSSPDGRPVNRVTAEQSRENSCAFSSSPSDAGSSDRMYRCDEQGGGVYTIRAYSGDEVWTAAVQIDANECHTTQVKDVDMVLDPNDHGDHDVDQDDQDDEDDES